jgi:histidinol-phosphate aminotransferase
LAPAAAGSAADADAFLSARNIVVRRMDAYGLPHALRISIGDADGCQALIEALQEFMDQGS